MKITTEIYPRDSEEKLKLIPDNSVDLIVTSPPYADQRNLHIIAVNGCCYGRDKHPDKGDYFKYCGQLFWEFISGDNNLFTEIIEPLGYQAKEKNDEFIKSYSQMINKFTKEFAIKFCNNHGEIEWRKLVQFNSAIEEA